MCHCHQIEPANCVQQALLSNRKKMPETVQDLVIRVTDELILTPFASASLVNEILKGLLYQKSQIPYPYSWLKEAIEKRRKKLSESDANVSKKLNFTHENHYRTVSKACDFLEVLMKGIAKEFSENIIKEIVVMLGTSPNCPKEVVTIQIPHIDQEHIERNHISELNKHLQKVLRHIFLSQTWMDSVNTSLTCTNTYVYLKKLANESTFHLSSNDIFELCEPVIINSNVKHSKLHISYNPSSKGDCCRNLEIFDDDLKESSKVNSECLSSSTEKFIWCRSKGLFKGFKDCFVNQVSVCELW